MRCEALDPNSKNSQPKSKSTLRQTSSDIWSLGSLQQNRQKLTKPLAERPSMGRRIQSALSTALCAHSNPANVAHHSPLQLDTNPLLTDQQIYSLNNPLCALDSCMIYISMLILLTFYMYLIFLDFTMYLCFLTLRYW